MSRSYGTNRILVGLGGIGGSLVNRVAELVKTNDIEAENLGFMAVDSDTGQLRRHEYIGDDFCIELGASRGVMEQRLPHVPTAEYYAKGEGAGQKRLSGKIYYRAESEKVINSFVELYRQLEQRTAQHRLSTMIITGLGGGTGSGSFLDFAMDVWDEYEDGQLNDLRSGPHLWGLGVIPHNKEKKLAGANGVGALKELHHFLNHEPYRTIFSGYFLTTRQGMRPAQDKWLEEALVEFLFDFGFAPHSEEERESIRGVKGATPWDEEDLATHFQDTSKLATLGYYKAQFPDDDIRTFFKSDERIQRLKAEAQEARTKRLQRARREVNKLESEIAYHAEHRDEIEEAIEELEGGFLSGGHVNRLEDKLREIRGELDEKSTELHSAEDERDTARADMDVSEALREARQQRDRSEDRIKKRTPRDHNHVFEVVLDDDEIEALERLDYLDNPELCFRDVMDHLDRSDRYEARTFDMLNSGNIPFIPLANYNIELGERTEWLSSPRAKQLLNRRGFLRTDRQGRYVDPNEKVDNLYAVIVSASDNFERKTEHGVDEWNPNDEISSDYGKDVVAKPHVNELRRFQFTIYTLEIGLQVGALLPNQPSRLQDYSALLPKYTERFGDRGYEALMAHHALFMDDRYQTEELVDPDFQERYGNTYTAMTEYWRGYRPISDARRWDELPYLCAEVTAWSTELRTRLDNILDRLDELDRLTSTDDQAGQRQVDHAVRNLETDLEALRNDLRSLNDLVTGKGHLLSRFESVSEWVLAGGTRARTRASREAPSLLEEADEAIRSVLDVKPDEVTKKLHRLPGSVSIGRRQLERTWLSVRQGLEEIQSLIRDMDARLDRDAFTETEGTHHPEDVGEIDPTQVRDLDDPASTGPGTEEG